MNINKEFRCRMCDKVYSSASSLCNHNKKFHNTIKIKKDHTPINIKEEHASINKKQHIPINKEEQTDNINHKIKTYDCCFCNKSFKMRQYRWKHQKTCKKKEENIKYKEKMEVYEKTITKLKFELDHTKQNVNNSLIDTIIDKNKTIQELKDKISDKTVNYITPPKIQPPTLTINNIDIVSRPDDNYINATQMCQAGGKKISNWISLSMTKNIINIMESDIGIPVLLLDDDKHNNYWIHPDLAIQLAQWISAEFALQVSRWIRALFTNNNISIENKLLKEKNKELELKNQKIKLLEDTYLKRHKRTNYLEKYVVYLLTTKDHKNKRIYIVGKAINLKKRLSGYNKTCDHEVVYYKSCGNEENMNTAEHMVLTKLNQYREKANRDRFILPIEKDIDFFTNIIDKSVDFLQNNNEIVV